MLNRKLMLAITASALLLGACEETQGEDNNSANTEELEARIAELEASNEVLRDALADTGAEVAEEIDDSEDEVELEETEEETSASSGSGTRTDPITFGEEVNLVGTFNDRDADYEEFEADLAITIIETIRGDEAWQVIQNENQFNDPAPEGKEYIINRVRIALSNATNADLKADFNYREFDYISAGGSSYSHESTVIPDELNVELFNDGQAEGNVVGLIDVDDTPLLRFNSNIFFDTE